MAKDSETFTINVVQESGIVYWGECTVLFVPAEKETIAILAHHTPMIMKLGPGEVSIRNEHETQQLATINGGLVYVGENEATVLINL